MLTKWLLLATAVAFFACDSPDAPTPCPPDPSPAVAVILKDSVSGNLYSGQATVVADNGSFVDSATVTNAAQWGEVKLAPNRAGIYTVYVRTNPSYQEWRQGSIYVTKTNCGVNTAHLIALLQRPPQDTLSDFVAYYSGRDEFASRSLVHVRFQTNTYQLDVDGSEIGQLFPVPTSGRVTVRYSLISGQDTLGTKAVTFDLASGYHYFASAYVSPVRFGGSCTDGGLAVALRTPAGGISADTLFVQIGGIPKGAIC